MDFYCVWQLFHSQVTKSIGSLFTVIPIFEEIAPPESLLIDTQNLERILDDMNEYLNNKCFPNKKYIEKNWCWKKSASLLSKILLTIINSNEKLHINN